MLKVWLPDRSISFYATDTEHKNCCTRMSIFEGIGDPKLLSLTLPPYWEISNAFRSQKFLNIFLVNHTKFHAHIINGPTVAKIYPLPLYS